MGYYNLGCKLTFFFIAWAIFTAIVLKKSELFIVLPKFMV